MYGERDKSESPESTRARSTLTTGVYSRKSLCQSILFFRRESEGAISTVSPALMTGRLIHSNGITWPEHSHSSELESPSGRYSRIRLCERRANSFMLWFLSALSKIIFLVPEIDLSSKNLVLNSRSRIDVISELRRLYFDSDFTFALSLNEYACVISGIDSEPRRTARSFPAISPSLHLDEPVISPWDNEDSIMFNVRSALRVNACENVLCVRGSR